VSAKKPDSYYAALVKALRPLAKGFEASDGYDLHHELTRARKRRIEAYAQEVRELTARENYQFRGRNKQHLKTAQEVAQHSPGFRLKVAFIPWTKPLGSKVATPKLHFTKAAVVIDTPNYQKQFIPFNKKKLITDEDLELARICAMIPAKAVVQIQTGKYVIGNVYSKEYATVRVKMLKAKYDGRTPLDASFKSKHGKKAKDHHWKNWLNGFVVYKFKAGGAGSNATRIAEAQAKWRKQHQAWKKAAQQRDRDARKAAKRTRGKS